MATIRGQLHRNSCGLTEDPTSCGGEDWTGTRLKFSLATSISFCYLLDKFSSSLTEGTHQIMAKTNESFIADIYFTYKFSRRHLSEHQYKTMNRKTLIPGINSDRAKACSYTSHLDTTGPAASPVESCLSLGTRPHKIGFLYSASYRIGYQGDTRHLSFSPEQAPGLRTASLCLKWAVGSLAGQPVLTDSPSSTPCSTASQNLRVRAVLAIKSNLSSDKWLRPERGSDL